MNNNNDIINYKGWTITLEEFGCTVFYNGDEFVFDTETEAKEFIEGEVEKC